MFFCSLEIRYIFFRHLVYKILQKEYVNHESICPCLCVHLYASLIVYPLSCPCLYVYMSICLYVHVHVHIHVHVNVNVHVHVKILKRVFLLSFNVKIQNFLPKTIFNTFMGINPLLRLFILPYIRPCRCI